MRWKRPAAKIPVLLLVLCLLPGASAGPAGQTQGDRRLTLEVIRSVRELSSPRLAPDGERVVYVVDEPAGGGHGRRSSLWLVPTDGGGSPGRLTDGHAGDGAPRWAPDGETVAFLSDRGGRRQVWVVEAGPAATREATSDPAVSGSAAVSAPRQLGDVDGTVVELAWSPDGETLALVATAGRGRGAGQHIELLDASSGSHRRLTVEPGFAISLDWSPDGTSIVYSTQEEPGFYGAFKSDLHTIAVADGAVAPLVVRPGVDRSPRWSPDGSTIAFVSGYGVPGGLLPAMGPALVRAAGGTPRDVGRAYDRGGFFEGPQRLDWSPEGDAVFFSVSHGVATRIVRLDVPGGVARPFTPADSSHGSPHVAAGIGRMALLASAYHKPAEVEVTPLDAFDPARLTDANAQLRDVAFPRAEVIEWQAPDGLTIHGLLVRPPDHVPGRRYPTVTLLHGGPATSVGQGFWGMTFYNPYRDDLLAASGFVVLVPNPRGSGGFGDAFRRAAAGDWGEGPLGDVLAGVDHLVEEGIADPDRLGVAGWSYGGYLTAWAVARTDRFRAASVGAGVFDLESHFGQAREQMLEYFGGPPWQVPEVYERNSPITFAGSIATPTQVIHGETDGAVSFAQGQLLNAALLQLDVPGEFLAYPDQGHTLTDPGIQDEAWEAVVAWFDRWLRADRREPEGGA